ncbi:MAG TPA: PEPxxWA-CTERM sorting domain-containing protein [Sphingobium sp.]
MRLLVGLIAAAALLSGGANAANLVVNGDFEAGNSGFTSQYIYAPAGNSTEGEYTIRSNPFPWNGNFISAADHTTGSGQMMVINGSPNAGDIVWQSSVINLAQNTSYFFEAFVMNVCCNSGQVINPPVLTFSVSFDGGAKVDLNTAFTPNVNGVWAGLSNSFNSGSALTAQLFLINANTIRAGNDFAIDDINLDTKSIVIGVPEPESWALMIAGFGLVGGAMRSRRMKVSYRAA